MAAKKGSKAAGTKAKAKKAASTKKAGERSKKESKSVKTKKKAPLKKAILKVDYDPNTVTWTIDPKVYPLDILYQAAFIFIDRAYMLLDMDKDKNIIVRLKGKEDLKKEELEALHGDFANELLNQAVRKQVAKDNRRIREFIVAKALFAAARPQELSEIVSSVSQDRTGPDEAQRPWDEATQEEQDELDRLLAEIEADFADDPMGIAVPWDEKHGADQDSTGKKKSDD